MSLLELLQKHLTECSMDNQSIILIENNDSTICIWHLFY